MLSVLITILIVLVLVSIALLGWLMSSLTCARRESASQTSAVAMLNAQLEALKDSQDKSRDTIQNSLTAGQLTLNQSLISSRQTLDNLYKQIGQVASSSQQMLKVGEEVRRLQDILSSPKLRGQMGEWSLANLLANVLPAASFTLQHAMKDGKIVDAMILTRDYSVPVDAKFPLPAFERLCTADTDDDRLKLRKQFHRDVIIHIDKIADNYIRPAEGTLDFAFCYIPAENIYYETIIKHNGETTDILQYALDRKVIPVSPNLLYAYLMTISMGLQGLQIEKQAAEIRQNLKKLNADFAGFINDWDTLGKHIRNTSGKYDEAGKKLDRFSLELERTHCEQEKAE